MSTIEYYSTDDDIVKIRPNILSLGTSCWETQHVEAFAIINRILVGKWYKQVAGEYGYDWRMTAFDPDLVETSQMVRLSSYKTLELAYLYLMKDTPEPDGFFREHQLFQKLFAGELSSLLAIGITYDWNADDEITYDEKYAPRLRRQSRA